MPPSISVIMPALNEERNIASAIEGALQALSRAGIEDFEILVATCPDRNGYLDQTGALVTEASGRDARIRLLHSDAYQQLGEKYRAAVLAAQKEYVVMIPGDNENDSESFLDLFRRVGEADMVISYTANQQARPLHRQLISHTYTFALNQLFGRRMNYYNGINVYRRTHLAQVLPQTVSFAYSAEILLTLLSRGATFVEVSVMVRPQRGGSKALRWENLVGVVRSIFGLRQRLRGTPSGSAAHASRPAIAIIGAGFVGSALGRYFETQGIRPSFYDPPKGLADVSVLAAADVIFIAVPTPYYLDGTGFDDRFLREALSAIPADGKTVVLKSTLQPGTTERLQQAYPQHRILFNPEFLTESRADEDMQHPNRQIVGVTEQSRGDAEQVLALLPRAPFEKIVPARVAETLKCAGNSFYALKVSFANQLYEFCERAGVDYDMLKQCIIAEPWMGEMHWDAMHKGYRGYGGKCLPKDLRMTVQAAEAAGSDLSLLKHAEAYNNALLASQGLDIHWEEGSPPKNF